MGAFRPKTRSVLVGTQDVSGLDFTAIVVESVTGFVSAVYESRPTP